MHTDVDRFLVREAKKLSSEYALRGGDAIHLAAAIRLEAKFLMTYDNRFPIGETVSGVTVTRPTEVWEPTLLALVEQTDDEGSA